MKDILNRIWTEVAIGMDTVVFKNWDNITAKSADTTFIRVKSNFMDRIWNNTYESQVRNQIRSETV